MNDLTQSRVVEVPLNDFLRVYVTPAGEAMARKVEAELPALCADFTALADKKGPA